MARTAGRQRTLKPPAGPVLIDTHVLLWYHLAPRKLPRRVQVLLQDRRTRVFVSAMTALEIAIKFRIGKLPEAAAFVAHYEAILGHYGFESVALDGPAAISVAALDPAHGDPFDTVLAAQALLLDVPLVTRDRAFTMFKGLKTSW